MRHAALVVAMGLSAPLAVAAPVTVHHQARLTDPFGEPITTPVDVTFELWTQELGGLNPFTETLTVTPVDGFISVDLGADAVTLDSSMLPGAWLQLRVDTVAMGDRTPLSTVPNSAHAERASGVDASTALPACNTANAGGMHFDTSEDQLYVCAVGGGWLPVSTTETITTGVTYTIGASGADFPDLQAAYNHLDSVRIATSGFVTLQLQPGTYNHTSTIDLGHVDGERIAIYGDLSDASNVVLQFTGSTNGLFLDTNYALHRLDGLTVRGDGADTNRAISVSGNLDRLGPELHIDNWTGVGVYVYQGTVATGSFDFVGVPTSPSSVGLAAYYKSSVVLGGVNISNSGTDAVVLSDSTGIMADLTITNSANGGLEVRNHSTFLGNDLTITNVTGTPLLIGEASYAASGRMMINANNNPGIDCVVVTENSTFEGGVATVQNCGGKGVLVTYNSFGYLNDSSFTSTAESACVAHYRAIARCQNSSFSNVASYAGEAIEGGLVMLSNPTGTGDLGLVNDVSAINVERADGSMILQ